MEFFRILLCICYCSGLRSRFSELFCFSVRIFVFERPYTHFGSMPSRCVRVVHPLFNYTASPYLTCVAVRLIMDTRHDPHWVGLYFYIVFIFLLVVWALNTCLLHVALGDPSTSVTNTTRSTPFATSQLPQLLPAPPPPTTPGPTHCICVCIV